MEEVKRALARTNLAQAALLTLPWTLLQVGGFWAAADARAGLTGAIVVGVMSVGALVALAVHYRRSVIRLANLIHAREGMDPVEIYGFFSFSRLWGDRLESVRRRIPGYVNTLRMNYISLPMAFLAAVLNFWVAALFLVLVWGATGMLVRSAEVRSVTGEMRAVSSSTWGRILLLFAVAAAAWGYVRYEAAVAEAACREQTARLRAESFLMSASELASGYRLSGKNGADAVRALTRLPAVPEVLTRLAEGVRIENVSPDSYVEMEKFVFEHGATMEALAEIGRIPAARLGFVFKPGSAGAGAQGTELLARYRKLETLERLKFYASAAVGNSRRVEESWSVLGTLRRQLSGEPLLSGCRTVMEMEFRRLGALERLLNEFGVYGKNEADFFASDLALTELEFGKILPAALKSEASWNLLSGFDPLSEMNGGSNWRSLGRIFPVLEWSRAESLAVYLEGMRMFAAVIAEPGKSAGYRTWSGNLPIGTLPGLIALREADGTVARYFALVRKLRAGRVALELDRYHKERGAFPATLEGLKGVSGAVRVDPQTGGALAYRNGKFPVEQGNPRTTGTEKRKTDGVEIGGEDGFRLRR